MTNRKRREARSLVNLIYLLYLTHLQICEICEIGNEMKFILEDVLSMNRKESAHIYDRYCMF